MGLFLSLKFLYLNFLYIHDSLGKFWDFRVYDLVGKAEFLMTFQSPSWVNVSQKAFESFKIYIFNNHENLTEFSQLTNLKIFNSLSKMKNSLLHPPLNILERLQFKCFQRLHQPNRHTEKINNHHWI